MRVGAYSGEFRRSYLTGIAWARRTWPDQLRKALAAEYARDQVMRVARKYDHVKKDLRLLGTTPAPAHPGRSPRARCTEALRVNSCLVQNLGCLRALVLVMSSP